jgi:uncharacterized membrane protein
MNLDLGTPAALWLSAVVPVVWFLTRFGGSPARRHPAPALARSAVLMCLAAALAEPALSLPASRVALVAVVDASHSVSSAALGSAATAIDEFTAALRPASSQVLAFGGRTAALADTAALRRLSAPGARDALDTLVSPEATNIEQALAAARADVPPGTNARVVLFSDGHETAGDSRRIAERLAAVHVPVFTRALAVRDLGDTWIDEIRLPQQPLAGSPATVEIVLQSQRVRPVAVSVVERGQPLAQATIEAGLGTTVLPMQVRWTTAGPHLLEAAFTSLPGQPDPLEDNNRLAVEVVVEPQPRLLYVHGGTDATPFAARLLAESGFRVTDASPEALPTVADGFDRWDVVLLSNVARPRLSPATMTALAAWVEDRGGGLFFVGGPGLPGDDADPDRPDYRRTELERVLPVTFDREDEAELALVIVLDRSWSMNGAAMDLSKQAAAAAATALDPSHLVGVLTFNNQPSWDVPVARLRDARTTLQEAIDGIRASGPTDIYLALAQAYDALATLPARAKHLILLSDGQTEPADFEGLMRKMTDARVTVSSVALGAEADVTLLRNLALWGGGRSYVVQDAQEVPEIFVKEAKSAADGDDDSAGIRLLLRATRLVGDVADELPVLQAHNPVTRKPGAIELLSTARGVPILTIWPAGLGRSAMFAADIDGRWTRDWLTWQGFSALLSSLLRTLAPHHVPVRTLDVRAGEHEGARRVLTVELDARTTDGHPENLLDPLVEVRTPGEPPARLALQQVGPGRYESRAVADVTSPLTFDLPGFEERGRIFAADSAAEYRFGTPDARRLAELAYVTGGVPDATVADLQGLAAAPVTVRHALAPWLILAALASWLLDIGLRRWVR